MAMDVEGAAATVGAGAGVGGKRAGAGRWLVGDLAVSRRRDGMEMKSPLVDGLLSDWDQVRVAVCFCVCVRVWLVVLIAGWLVGFLCFGVIGYLFDCLLACLCVPVKRSVPWGKVGTLTNCDHSLSR